MAPNADAAARRRAQALNTGISAMRVVNAGDLFSALVRVIRAWGTSRTVSEVALGWAAGRIAPTWHEPRENVSAFDAGFALRRSGCSAEG